MSPIDFPGDDGGGGGGGNGTTAIPWTLVGKTLDAGDYLLSLELAVTTLGTGSLSGKLRHTNADGLQTAEVVTLTMTAVGSAIGRLQVYIPAGQSVEYAVDPTGGGGGEVYTALPLMRPAFLPRFSALAFEMFDGADTTRRVRFDASTVPTATTVNLKMPAADGTLARLADITGGVSDGDKGDITVSGAGAVYTVDPDAITYAKMQNVSATDRLLGRATAGAGDPEEIACTAAGRAILDDADAAAQRATLGLGGAATLSLVDILSAMMRVGYTFETEEAANPSTYYGFGTWALHGVGRVTVCLDAGDADFNAAEETGGAKTVAAAGGNAAEATHTHSVTSNVTIGNEAAHTHNYTQVPNHVHPFTINSSTTDGTWASFDSSTTAGTPRNFNTANPTGGVATATTEAGSSHTHTPTNNAVTSGAGSSHNHAFTGSATSVVQPYIVVYRWKRTA